MYIYYEKILFAFSSLSLGYIYICGVVVWTFNIFQLECKWYGAFLEYKITITLKGIKNAAALKKILHNRYIYIYYTPKINLILVTKVLSYKTSARRKKKVKVMMIYDHLKMKLKFSLFLYVFLSLVINFSSITTRF